MCTNKAKIPLVVLLLLTSQTVLATGFSIDGTFISVSGAVAQSKLETGYNVEGKYHKGLFYSSLSATNLGDVTITNLNGGINIPLSEKFNPLLSLSIGIGSEGFNHKPGLSFSISDSPVLITIKRETYTEHHEFSNTQLGLIFWFN